MWEKYYNDVSLPLKVSINISLVNICLRNISEGEDNFRFEFRDIYKILLRDNLYFNNIKKPVFSNKLFKAIITNSIYINELRWAEDFLGKYVDKVEPEFMDNLYNYSMSLIRFKQQRYDESLLYAGKIEQKQIIYKLDSKNIISKIYYETGSLENLIPLLDSYKQMIINSEIKNDLTGKSHLAFINLLKKIVLADKALPELRTKTVNTKIINSKQWLLEKINELK